MNLEAPEDALSGEIGERIPIGLDLEWEVDGSIHAHDDDWAVAGYIEPGIVHGEVLLGRERFELDACGAYHRTWGDRDWRGTGAWSLACTGPGLGLHVAGLPNGHVDGFMRRGEEPARDITRARREASTSAARIVVDDDIEIEVDVLMDAPVPIDDHSFLDRALCRVRASDVVETGWSSVLAAR